MSHRGATLRAMPRKLQPDRYAVNRQCTRCQAIDSTTVEQEPFTPPPEVAELEQGEWSCANGCGDECAITVAKLAPAWRRAFR